MTPDTNHGGRRNRCLRREEPSADIPVSAAKALRSGRDCLRAHMPGTQTGEERDGSCGYRPTHVLGDGQIEGTLSVGGYSGEVWYHDWHGQYLGMLEAHES